MVSPPLSVTILNWRDTGHPEGGGSERYVERIAAGLAADGCRVTVRCARYPGAARRERRDGFTMIRAGGRFGVYPAALAGLLTDRVLRRAPDVVLDVQNGVPFFARLVAGRPTVVLVHHVHREQWDVALGGVRARFGWWVESWLAPRLHRASQYVTVSEVTRSELADLGVDPRRIAVVHNGTDPRPTMPARRSPAPRLVVLGRLVPHKRVEHALEVLARLAPRIPGLELDVVGDGWWHDRLVAHAKALGVTDAVTFHGHLTESAKHEVLSQAWVMLAPSLKEGWGLMVVEAGQHGVPTVAYRAAGGLAESVQDGVTGVLVDDLDGLVGATRDLLLRADVRRRLGRAASRRATRFTWTSATTRMLGLLRAAAVGRPPVATTDSTNETLALPGGAAADLTYSE